jgi:hypothetical protein
MAASYAAVWAKAARASLRRVAADSDPAENRGVVSRRRHDRHVLVVLGRGAHHGRAADVDELDGGVRGEGIQVGHHEVDGADAVRLEVSHVLGLGAVGQDPAMDLGVQGLDPSAQHLGRAGDLCHLGVRDAGCGEGGGGVATGHELPAEVGQAVGELHEAFLVVDRQQGSHDVISLRAPSLPSCPSSRAGIPRSFTAGPGPSPVTPRGSRALRSRGPPRARRAPTPPSQGRASAPPP